MVRLAIAAVALCVLALVGTRFYLSRSIQSRSGEVWLESLGERVEVTYDDWSIPRITARNEEDLLRAQGFVHAGERLWQMELFQRTAQGRLSELFGEPALEVDRLMRTLGVWETSGLESAWLEPEHLALLEAYAEGVNDRIATWRGPLPPEFILLGIAPQPWTPVATLSIVRLMALDLTNWRDDLGQVEHLAELDLAHRELFRPWHPSSDPTIVQASPILPFRVTNGWGAWNPPSRSGPAETGDRDRSADSTGSPWASSPSLAEFDPLGLLAGVGLNASNSWALSPERTASGHALLAGDTHLGLRAPSTWFLNALRVDPNEAEAESAEGEPAGLGEDRGGLGEEARRRDGREEPEGGEGARRLLDVAGLSIPGAPLIVIGMNRHVAWTFTNGNIDDSDFYVETVGADGESYVEDGEERSFELRREWIEVRGGAASELVVRSTVRGPVITDLFPTAGLTLSLAWTGLEAVGPIGGLAAMNRSSTADEISEAAGGFASPHQNLLYATARGRIGFRLVGRIPDRPRGGVGVIPVEGGGGWTGFIAHDSLPALEDPASGYLATANNLQSPDAYGRVAVAYPIPDRARRIDQVVSQARDWSVAEMAELQLDSHSLWAERYRERAVAAAGRAGRHELSARLAGWDLSTEPHSLGAAPYYAWLYRLRALVVADDLGEDGTLPGYAFLRIMEEGRENRGQGALWADDVRTDTAESFPGMEELALDAALPLLDSRWGEVSLEQHEHPFGGVPILNLLFGFNIGPYPARGGPYTVRPVHRTSWSALDSTSWSYPRVNTSGPSQRFVARMDPSGPVGFFKLPTGQSGNPFDRHYRDMAAGWAEPWLIELSPGAWEGEPASRLWLVPGR